MTKRGRNQERRNGDAPAPPDPAQLVWRSLWRLGPVGVVLFLVLLGLWHWDDLRRTPVVGGLLSALHRNRQAGGLFSSALPKADPHSFSVGVAHLAGDEGHEIEKRVVSALTDVDGIQLLRFDRTLETEGSHPKDDFADAERRAHGYLEASGADVIVWGSVSTFNGRKNGVKLHWVTGERRVAHRLAGDRVSEEQPLPLLFWEDLRDVLRLVAAQASARVLERYGKVDLRPFIEQVRQLCDTARQLRWGPEVDAQIELTLAMSLEEIGEATGRREPLDEARRRLEKVTGEGHLSPRLLGTATNTLGNVLRFLGEHQRGTELLTLAVARYRDALALRDAPLDVAITEHNLGSALRVLGERDGSQAWNEQAVAAAEAAIAGLERAGRGSGALRSIVEMGYANALVASTTEGADAGARLDKAIAALRTALELPPQDAPRVWALAQCNLCNALRMRAVTQRNDPQKAVETLKEAKNACDEALAHASRQDDPRTWSKSQNNLGLALGVLSDLERRPEGLSEAVRAFRAALEVQTLEGDPSSFARTQANLGVALLQIAATEPGTIHLDEAVNAFDEALRVDDAFRDRARVERLRGIARALRARRTAGTSGPAGSATEGDRTPSSR